MPGRITHGKAANLRPDAAPLAVVDIGSNSVRLVVYEGPNRIPFPVYNEKVLCGLGRGLDETGKLSPDGVTLAIATLCRFVALVDAMGVKEVVAVATAAVREAADGPAFVARVMQECGLPVSIITGEEEARLAGQGVIAAFERPEGVAADLGGGSLELVEIDGLRVGALASLPIGPIRLSPQSLARRPEMLQIVDEALQPLPWLASAKGRTLYLIGGAWRAFARFHMIRINYALHVTHEYAIPAREAAEFAAFVSSLSQKTLQQVAGLSRRRVEVLPYAALVLGRLIALSGVENVVFSAYGLREGTLVGRLGVHSPDTDPLIAACKAVAQLNGRVTGDGEALFHWMKGAFPDETPREQRLRRAACLLADLEWSEHPDYRVEHALLRILRYPLVGVTHRSRAFIAVAVSSRHARVPERLFERFIAPLLPGEEAAKARALGLVMRLAYSTTGGVIRLLEVTQLRRRNKRLELVVPREEAVLVGELVERRLRSLSRHLGCEGRIVLTGPAAKANRRSA